MRARAIVPPATAEFDRAIPLADLADATPLNALLLDEMPLGAHFRRDHFPAPDVRPAEWALQVTGAVRRPLTLDVDALRRLGGRSERVVLECAGHRRTEYAPAVPGLAWAEGAVGEARWTGAPLAAVLERAGVLASARSVVLEGADSGPFEGRDGEHPFARELPLAKALAPETTLTWAVNRRADSAAAWRSRAGDRSRLVCDRLRQMARADHGPRDRVHRALGARGLPLPRAGRDRSRPPHDGAPRPRPDRRAANAGRAAPGAGDRARHRLGRRRRHRSRRRADQRWALARRGARAVARNARAALLVGAVDRHAWSPPHRGASDRRGGRPPARGRALESRRLRQQRRPRRRA